MYIFYCNWFFFVGYQHYCNLQKRVLNHVPFPDLVIYLKAVPGECQKRIATRGRVR